MRARVSFEGRRFNRIMWDVCARSSRGFEVMNGFIFGATCHSSSPLLRFVASIAPLDAIPPSVNSFLSSYFSIHLEAKKSGPSRARCDGWEGLPRVMWVFCRRLFPYVPRLVGATCKSNETQVLQRYALILARVSSILLPFLRLPFNYSSRVEVEGRR